MDDVQAGGGIGVETFKDLFERKIGVAPHALATRRGLISLISSSYNACFQKAFQREARTITFGI